MPGAGEEQVGRVLGRRYRLVAPVGAGASAMVFVADDVVLKRRVAVKLLHPSLADDPMFLKRFRAEAQAAAALNHANIMAVHDWGEDDGEAFLVTEYLSGGSLRSMLDRNRLLTPSQALLVGLAAARGLDYAHRRGFVHRDIKPANLLFDDDAGLRIADFGLARALAEAAWTEPAGVVLGTARYASPEQARGLAVDGKSDVYSLALVLVEAVTGQVPFAADTTVATLMNRIDKLLPVGAELGPLAPVLERAGRPHPDERYTAAEMGRALIQTAERLPRPAALPLVATAPTAGPADTQRPPVSATAATTGGPTARAGEPGGVAPTGAVATASPAGTPGTGQLDVRAAGPATAAAAGSTTSAAAAGSNGRNGSPATVTAGGPPTGGPPAVYDEGPEPRRSRKRLIVGIVATLLVIAGVAVGVVAYLRASVTTYPVPPLVGVEIARARNIVSQYDWQVEERSGRNDTYPTGVVYQQEPTTGSLERGDPIVLYVSEGPFPSKLPDLVGKDQAAATTMLTDAGLTLGTVGNQFDETAPAGTVLAWTVGGQSFTPGTEVTKGTTVDLVVSGGPQPRVLPALIGQSLEQATAQLQQLGLVLTRAPDVFSDATAVGLIAELAPPAGTELPRGSSVTVAVSKGPDVVTVPNVVGLDLTTAVANLTQAGLTQGTISGPIEGKVLATNPGPTAVVKRGSAVEIVMA
jgi:beta-lactam-binding protein with PASTA domain/tRNA A-37 threonylcarbamoyl transferase component Bud32